MATKSLVNVALIGVMATNVNQHDFNRIALEARIVKLRYLFAQPQDWTDTILNSFPENKRGANLFVPAFSGVSAGALADCEYWSVLNLYAIDLPIAGWGTLQCAE